MTTQAAAKNDIALLETLARTVDALSQRRARDIPEQTIDTFVALRWLEWNGGNLRLTEAGQVVLLKAQAAMIENLQAA
jgi:archaellum component FlaD/FlaE